MASVLALVSYLAVGFVVRLWLTIGHLDAHDAHVHVFGYEFHHALIGIACLLAAGLFALNDARPRARCRVDRGHIDPCLQEGIYDPPALDTVGACASLYLTSPFG